MLGLLSVEAATGSEIYDILYDISHLMKNNVLSGVVYMVHPLTVGCGCGVWRNTHTLLELKSRNIT